MLKILFCCFMKSSAEPIHIDLVSRPKSPVAYRPDSVQPFTPQETEYFKSLKQYTLKQDIEISGK